jgi:hypothetical protein
MHLPDSKAVATWITKAFSEGDGSPSVKRLLFGVAVISAILFCAIDLTIHRGLTSTAGDLLKNIGFVTGGAYGIGRFAEATENNKQP